MHQSQAHCSNWLLAAADRHPFVAFPGAGAAGDKTLMVKDL